MTIKAATAANTSVTTTQQWQRMDAQHHFHPFSNNADIRAEGSRIIERAEGCHLWDSDGKQYLDAFAGLWCVNLGYGRQELVQAASQQMQQLPYYNLFFKTTTTPVIELAHEIADIAPSHMNQVFFTGSGSEANDTVFRMVRRYWDIQNQPERKIIIGRKNGYHGSTVAGASLGGMPGMHKQGDLPIAGVEHVDQPYWYGEGGDLTPHEFGVRAARSLEEKIKALGSHKVAAFIAEPIQGAGGVIIPPDSYWPEIQRIVKKYGILLVVDEVICGFGRTGEWFGSQYYHLQPDLMPIAKGLSSGYLPIGGVVMADHFAETLAKGGDFNHGYTYSGHPVCAAVALENVRILKRERIVERVKEDIGPKFQQAIATLADHPLVGEVRGVGLLGAIELVKDRTTRLRYPDEGSTGTLCRDMALQDGLVLRATGDTMMMSPPLVINDQHLDELITKTKSALDKTWHRLKGK